MTEYRLEPSANRRLDEIYRYTAAHWGQSGADDYIRAMFDQFDAIASKSVPWRRISASLAVEGYRRGWRSHVIYWKISPDGSILIVSILHRRMNQIDHLVEDFRREP